MNENYEKIVSFIEDVADIAREDITLDSALIDDLDLASLEIMSIVSKIEREYSIRISEQELLSIETVQDLVQIVSK